LSTADQATAVFASARLGSAINVPVMVAIRLSVPSHSAAAAVGQVDAARLKNVGRLYRATGLEADDADAQAFLFYCFVFGQSLLVLDRGQRRRAQLIAKSAKKLLDERI
jgi:hypothetical protein